MVKPVKLVEGKEKIQIVTITYQDYHFANDDVDDMNVVQNQEKFVDVTGLQAQSEWFQMMMRNGNTVLLPRTEIKRIDITNIDKE